ncbi:MULTISPECIES: peptidoglycan recognition protein [unclassified Streptomyces]|uniref:Peptidoglycan recognition protein n=1 Tax=Streptomyces sp. NBC_00119 TaxID=2975659 RepID=A0AAU1UDP9_9ACTN|nr:MULTISPECIES: peptidoglycan recognition protein [unclassified Streptomyces]MCX4645888.1 peptidoglycan recognition protein [Streptomyces sp. NBC_01446]MCX5318512.1 peptidoglycan recognition protein [Streptomyces sp. NBC_00120]
MRVFRMTLCCAPAATVFGLLLMCAVTVGPGDGGSAAKPGGAAGLTPADRAAPALPPAAVPVRRPPVLSLAAVPANRPHTAALPRIVPRADWLADAAFRRPPARYADRVTAIFIHHTDSPNDYDCADTPRIIRSLYMGQAGSRNWDDIGYNFLVDRCGTIYEGRAGGVDKAVVGAHAQGFNKGTAGIAAIGTFIAGTPVPPSMAKSIAALSAWKLGLANVDPRSRVRLTSTNSLSRFPKGRTAEFNAIAAHRDEYETYCPGQALMAALPEIRQRAAALQGR